MSGCKDGSVVADKKAGAIQNLIAEGKTEFLNVHGMYVQFIGR